MDTILTKERRNALGSLITNWLSEQDEDGRMLDTFDYFDVDKIDALIDEAIAPAIADAVVCATAALSAPAEATQAVAVPNDAAITACALMIKGICMTRPQESWGADIEGRIRFLLAAAPQAPVADAARADDRVPSFIPTAAHDCAFWQGGAKLGVAASPQIAEETAAAINAWNRARAQQPACVWGASTLADLDAAIDGAHELSGAPHERITELIRQRDEARAAAAPAPQAVALTDDARDALQAEIDRLNAIINTPQSDDFLRAVSIEAEHQRQRWGSEHDSGKTPADWFWLVGFLAGKALQAHYAPNLEKAEHHVITTAAACANWHSAMFGKTDVRPGIAVDDALQSHPEGDQP